MELFQNWFYSKLTVSSFPTLEDIHSDGYDSCKYRINVSDIYKPEIDTACLELGVKSNWFPLGEAFGMPLESIYAALRVMHEAEKQNQHLLLHCHAGRNRSVLVADCYYFLSTMTHRKKNQKDLPYAQKNTNRIMPNIDDGQLPGIYKMEEFLEYCLETFSDSFSDPVRPIDWIKHQLHIKGSGFTDQSQ